MPDSINDKLYDHQIATQIRFIKLQNREVREALSILASTERKVKRALLDSNLDEGSYSKTRLNALKAQIAALMKALEEKLTPVLVSNVSEASKLSAQIESQALSLVLPIGIDITTPNLGVLQTAAVAAPFNGGTTTEWAKSFHRTLNETTWRGVVEGITQGADTPEIVRGLLGTKSKKYKDGKLEARRRGLTALVRTSINHATNRGRSGVWEANADLLSGVMWVSTLDSRTTPICQHNDGRVGPVVDSGEWTPPGGRARIDPPSARPPAHVNCRSTTVAITKSWQELGIDMDELPEATRASANGQVPGKTTYYQWLNKQSPDVQKEILGPKRLSLWKDKGISPENFTNDQGVLLTLDDLRKAHNLN